MVFIAWTLYECIKRDHQVAWGLLILFVLFSIGKNLIDPFLGKDLDLPFWLSHSSTLLGLVLASNLITFILFPLPLPVIASIKEYYDKLSYIGRDD